MSLETVAVLPRQVLFLRRYETPGISLPFDRFEMGDAREEGERKVVCVCVFVSVCVCLCLYVCAGE